MATPSSIFFYAVGGSEEVRRSRTQLLCELTPQDLLGQCFTLSPAPAVFPLPNYIPLVIAEPPEPSVDSCAVQEALNSTAPPELKSTDVVLVIGQMSAEALEGCSRGSRAKGAHHGSGLQLPYEGRKR